MPDLLPCAFCGSSDIECPRRIVCRFCGGSAGSAEAWNRRVTPASDDGVSRVVAMLRSKGCLEAVQRGICKGSGHDPNEQWPITHAAIEAHEPAWTTFDCEAHGAINAIASYIEEHARPAPSDDTPTRDELIEALTWAMPLIDIALSDNQERGFGPGRGVGLYDDETQQATLARSVLARTRRG